MIIVSFGVLIVVVAIAVAIPVTVTVTISVSIASAWIGVFNPARLAWLAILRRRNVTCVDNSKEEGGRQDSCDEYASR